jgi:crossover junction endodeoxyribonuclease RuvC
MRLTIGIDPGLSGAIAVLDESGMWVGLDDLETMALGARKWINGGWLSSFLLDLPPHEKITAFVENVSAMPQQGVASSFQFGLVQGSILGVLMARHIPIELVTPSKWKGDMGVTWPRGKDGTDGQRKHLVLSKARLMWPTAELHLAKHDGRAEALLIAAWGINKQRAIL